MGLGLAAPLEDAMLKRNLCCVGEVTCEALRLVELSFAFLESMERDGDNHVPTPSTKWVGGLLNEQLSEERFHPECTLIFVTVDKIEDHAFRANR